jgi:3-phosphoglycerate kinase
MTFKRLTDLDVSGKRVFIRADLNVPKTTTSPSPTTRVSAPHCPASSTLSPRAPP